MEDSNKTTDQAEFPLILKGERIELRTMEPVFANANMIFDVVVANRQHLLPWLGWASEEATKTPEDSFDFLAKIAKRRAEKTQFAFGIFLDARYIGGIDVVDISSKHKSAEIGYWLAADSVGKGYMSEAVRILEDAAFAQLGLNRIQIRCDALNAASANVAKRAGYIFEGTYRNVQFCAIRNEFADGMTFSKLRTEWEADIVAKTKGIIEG